MKKSPLLFICLFLTSIVYAQKYDANNSIARKALVQYVSDSRGFYQKQENKNMSIVENIINSYAYDKKSQELYIETATANCVVTVNKDYAKIFKKSKSIPQLKNKELTNAIAKTNKGLAEKFERINVARQRHIDDSIRIAREDSIRRREEALRKMQEDSIRRVREQQKLDNYRATHKWHWVPVAHGSYSCMLCDKSFSSIDSLACIAFKDDTLYHITWEELALGQQYIEVHKLPVTKAMRENEDFRYHLIAFTDSLTADKYDVTENTLLFNEAGRIDAIENVRKIAPYGFFEDWGWDDEYSFISFNFTYRNLNKKTIKYIDVYWRVTNDVGDVRRTGNFKGTGPVEPYSAGTWEWDSSMYYVAGDATHMDITKVILTYMDGTQKVLNKSMLRFN